MRNTILLQYKTSDKLSNDQNQQFEKNIQIKKQLFGI